jgi:uncharacterized protein YbjT (DUF2867 family)
MLRLICLSCTFIFLMACESSNTSTANKEKAVISEKPAKLILVSGVTGRQGGAVARALLKRGYKVRGLTRNPMSDRAQRISDLGVTVVKGDFEDVASLEAALENVHGVFLVTNFWEHGYEAEVQQGKNVVDAARKAKVRHLVFSSVANSDQSTGIPHFDSKYEIEQYIHATNIAFTILRPVSFMENWEYSREKILAGKISSPFSTSTRMQQISVRDIGRFAALAFSEPQNWTGKTLDIAGEEYTLKEVINLFSAVTGSPVEYVHIPWDVYEKSAGEEMTIMDRWIDSIGYSANINLVRSKLAGTMTLEEYLTEAGW